MQSILNNGKHFVRTVATAMILLGSIVSAVRAAEPVTEANVDQAVASAKTPEDHAALAAYFTSKAEAAMTSAEKHDKMAKSFAPSKSMASHCRALASADRKQAADYTALAKAQDALAKGTAGGKHKK